MVKLVYRNSADDVCLMQEYYIDGFDLTEVKNIGFKQRTHNSINDGVAP